MRLTEYDFANRSSVQLYPRISRRPHSRPGLPVVAELKISVPGADKDKVQAAAEEAHTVCPYSKATKGNIPVKLTVI